MVIYTFPVSQRCYWRRNCLARMQGRAARLFTEGTCTGASTITEKNGLFVTIIFLSFGDRCHLESWLNGKYQMGQQQIAQVLGYGQCCVPSLLQHRGDVCLFVCLSESWSGFMCFRTGLTRWGSIYECSVNGFIIAIVPALERAHLKYHFTSHVFVSPCMVSLFCPHTFPRVDFISRGIPALPKPDGFLKQKSHQVNAAGGFDHRNTVVSSWC